MPSRCRVAGVLAAVLALSACSSTPYFDRHFGQSVRATLASQVIDPAAVRNTNPVSGVDGRAAKGAQDRYEKSVEAPQALKGIMGGGVLK